MKQTLKYILVFGLPALVCGAGWALGIGFLTTFDHGPSLPDSWTLFCGMSAACSLPACLSGFFLRNRWLASHHVATDIFWALLHSLAGAILFGAGLMSLGMAADGGLIDIAFCLFAGAFFGLLYGTVLLPIQIIPAYLHLRLFRHLARRFSLMAAETRPQ